MVRFLATCCLLLFSLLTASAQAVDLPQCSPDQFSKIEELSPEISALEDEMGRAETVSDVLRLNTEHLVLRQKLWDDIHLCDMNLEFISLFSARFNDVFVVSAMEGLSPGQEDSVRMAAGGRLWAQRRLVCLFSNIGEYFLSRPDSAGAGIRLESGSGGALQRKATAICARRQINRAISKY